VAQAVAPLAGAVLLDRGSPSLTLAFLAGLGLLNGLLAAGLWIVTRAARVERAPSSLS
jgi:hypothetical protein